MPIGTTSQNRDAHPDFRAHIAGRVGHAAALFDRIAWDAHDVGR
ncbi:hypothetical protein [Burkholderia pyrrocinia]|nr:hypothetical protein [Burkholderia pyrrocinia]